MWAGRPATQITEERETSELWTGWSRHKQVAGHWFSPPTNQSAKICSAILAKNRYINLAWHCQQTLEICVPKLKYQTHKVSAMLAFQLKGIFLMLAPWHLFFLMANTTPRANAAQVSGTYAICNLAKWHAKSLDQWHWHVLPCHMTKMMFQSYITQAGSLSGWCR